ncbi:MAG: alpha/beta hydrolase, partial [Gammaproteobacteria bacterium]|nr:alpha/beta hydrolase [Gammaproteobacteria bacterium]
NVLAVDYRLAPEHRFPTAFLDAQDAFAWLRSHGQQRGLDPDMLAVGGDSVGGSLAATTCIAERQEGRTQPLLQLLIYPCTASHQDSGSHQRLGYGHLLESETLQWMFSQYLREEADRHDWRFAPLQTIDLRGLAPAHLVLAEYDPLFDEGQMYAARMRNARVSVDESIYAGQVHDFARLGNVTPQAQALRHALSTVLAAAFERATADTQDMNTTQPSASYI